MLQWFCCKPFSTFCDDYLLACMKGLKTEKMQYKFAILEVATVFMRGGTEKEVSCQGFSFYTQNSNWISVRLTGEACVYQV